MNNFKSKKISKEPTLPPLSEKTKNHIQTALAIILAIFFVYYGAQQIIAKIGNTRLLNVISSTFGKELAKDADGHTNILLLGVGGEGHEGKDLTDTIIIASLNSTDNSVAIMSFPRDLYLESSLGGSRINRLYEQGKNKWEEMEALDFAKDTIQKVLDMPLHYVIKVDFEAFKEVVDEVGGIDVYVEQEINDPMYPKGETYEFETFILPKGLQHLDGETALKYVRSRKTSSDFDRSKRQQQVILALKEKAATQSLFTRKGFLTNIYESMRDHFSTDLSLREMLTLADFASKWDSRNLSSATLNDEPIFTGGFLYTPLRELYGGAYVLLPAGNTFDSVQFFARLVLYGPKNRAVTGLAILNGTKEHGLASRALEVFNRFGANITKIANSSNQTLTQTTWYAVSPEAIPLMEYFQKLLPGKTGISVPPEYLSNPKLADAKIILEIGADSVEKIEKLDIFKDIFELKPQE